MTESIAEIGRPAPDFSLINHRGDEWRLSYHLGKVTVLLFYPQNETLVCSKQLCSVRDNWAKYLETKAAIVGISPGEVAEHVIFAHKYRLPLDLLADGGRRVTAIFGKHRFFPLALTRALVVIDAKGIVRTKEVFLRAFRPSDTEVIRHIYAARGDALHETFETIVRSKPASGDEDL